MSGENRDLFPTEKMSVPYLVPLLERLRDEQRSRTITVLHVRSFEEGEWICSTAAARLMRANVRIIGPEMAQVLDLVERAIRTGAKYVFAGQLRNEEDARAMRAAATLGIRPVGYIVKERRVDASNALTLLGSWNSYDVSLLSAYD
jgi:cell division inhibitor SulA